ncbi:hypothetical protein B0J13DRAFT_631049 [Dactylonectria estremocensis]|uniref:PD-(D/E)XK nuclease-like domain-containing protein n=1 Tax=Dactylonectria estremocensis TaxID=1079267 RepID=A0A9P9D7R6_9HYPO|nr:hypothetical protein B0J13DRAFT_631049 [Dactylonectria estremocensis]
MLSDESAWNNRVHVPTLDMFIYDMRNSSGQDVLDFMLWYHYNQHRLNVSPVSRWSESCRLTYVFRLLPERDQTTVTDSSYQPPLPDTAPCFNWTTDRLLLQYPLAISIEPKRYGGNVAKENSSWVSGMQRIGSFSHPGLALSPSISLSFH